MRTRNPQMDELFKCRGNNAASPKRFCVLRCRKIAVERQSAELFVLLVSQTVCQKRGEIGCVLETMLNFLKSIVALRGCV